MRLIDADVLIEMLTTAIRTMQSVAKFIGAEDDPEIKMEIKAYSDILDGVKGQPTIEPEPQWIPCSERLPEYGHPVLWCNENGSVFVSAITVKSDYGWAIGKRHRASAVVAWMPLPEPYKGGEQNGSD